MRVALTDETGTALAVSSGTYSLLDSEAAAVIDAQAASISGGSASYAVPSTFADAYDLPQTVWRERWVLSGVTGDAPVQQIERRVFLCRVAPVQIVDIDSLVSLHPQWRKQLMSARAAGRTGDPITLAWDQMIGRLLGDGLLPQRILSWDALATVHLYWAASLVCNDFATDAPDASRWAKLAPQYWSRAQEEYERITRAEIDDDEDGIADRSQAQLSAGGAPRMWRWT